MLLSVLQRMTYDNSVRCFVESVALYLISSHFYIFTNASVIPLAVQGNTIDEHSSLSFGSQNKLASKKVATAKQSEIGMHKKHRKKSGINHI